MKLHAATFEGLLIYKYLLSTNVNTAHPFSVFLRPNRSFAVYHGCTHPPNNSIRIASGTPSTQLIATGQGRMLYNLFIYTKFMQNVCGSVPPHARKEGKQNPNFQLISTKQFKKYATALCRKSVHVQI